MWGRRSRRRRGADPATAADVALGALAVGALAVWAWARDVSLPAVAIAVLAPVAVAQRGGGLEPLMFEACLLAIVAGREASRTGVVVGVLAVAEPVVVSAIQEHPDFSALLARDWTVLAFAFVFPAFETLILAGVFGSRPDAGYGMQRPDDYYVAASVGVPVTALALVGLPVALASYRERGVLRRFDAFGVPATKVVAAQALVTCGLVVIAAVLVLAVAAPAYGIPAVARPWETLAGLTAGTLTLVAVGVALGLAAPTARAAQAVGLLAFFPLYLLGGGGPPKGVMTGPMQTVSDVLPSTVPSLTDPWLGTGGVAPHLPVLAAWTAAALLATAWLARRRPA